MKRFLLSMLAVVLVACIFLSCSKDDEGSKFDYSMETLVGKWRITHIEQADGSMLDITTPIAERVFKPTYATFNNDGTYSGSGEFGNGSGTFKPIGKTITCYVSGKEYLKYDVLSLSGTECELKMYQSSSSSSIKIRCKKQ